MLIWDPFSRKHVQFTYMQKVHIYWIYKYILCEPTFLLTVPKSNQRTYGDRAFSVAAPKLWNSLHLDIRNSGLITLFKCKLRGEKLNYNSCTSLLLRKSQNLLLLAPEVQWALKVYRVCSIHVFFKCFEPCPYLVCHVTTIENV